MLTPRICVTLIAITSLAATLPAIAQPISESLGTQQTATKSISITDLVGVYQWIFRNDFKLTIRPDGSYEQIDRRDFRDSKTQTVTTGKVNIENNVVFFVAEKIDGKAVEVNQSLTSFKPDEFWSVQGGKALLLRSDPLVKFIKID
jgi:hypothetical protein